MSFPILDSLQAQLAVRYEDYGGAVGATTNPKLSLRWQALDWLALRGSYGTTFRAPPQTSLEGSNTTLAFTYTSYKPTVTIGNPDLDPETADTFNVGFLINVGDFSATLDYWNFVFQDALTTESGPQMVRAFFGAAGTAASDHCGDAGWEGLQSRFDFGGLACSATNLVSTTAYNVNSQTDTEVSGIDLGMRYLFSNVFTGDLTLGLDGTYNLEYKIGRNIIEGIEVDPAQDLVGTRGGRAGTEPEWKGAAYIDWGNDMHNVRWTTRYIDGASDVRTTILAGSAGKEIDGFLTHDVTYRVKLPWETTLSASVFNLLDEEPPFARLDLSYDPFIGNPLGRYWKVGVNKRF
jgi:iron complex outermembrane receptor protein